MLLGKRPRPPMRRTTSLTEFSADVGIVLDGTSPPPSAANQDQHAVPVAAQQYCCPVGPVPVEPSFGVHHLPRVGAAGGDRHHHFTLPSIHRPTEVRYYGCTASRRPRRKSAGFQIETAHFLKACGLCNRRLNPGKDIYMYRGEIAFCSSECRQQQMTLDERKENKCSLTTINNDTPHASSAATSNTVPEPTAPNGETVAAA